MAGETITRLRVAATVDAWGNSINSDWSTASRLTITGCALSPLAEPEVHTDGRDAVPGSWTLYIPGRFEDIEPSDRIETSYGTFDVDGEPGRFRSPFSGRDGMTVRLNRTEG